MPATMSIIPHAQSYIQRGWAVLPLHGIVNGKCTCGSGVCTPCGKHPRNFDGSRGAIKDLNALGSWVKHDCVNIGIATGKTSNLIVIDADEREDRNGLDGLRSLNGGVWAPECPTVRTGSGTHYYFSCPEDYEVHNSAGLVAPGVDIRGEGGYVVAPPSDHHSGRSYVWLEFEDLIPPPLPVTILDKIKRIQSRTDQPKSEPIIPGALPSATERPEILNGQRNNTLTAIGGGMRRYGATANEILARLLVENRKCVPPLEEREVVLIARSVSRYEPDIEKEDMEAGKIIDVGRFIHETPSNKRRKVEVENKLPPHLLLPGGMLQEMMDYCLATSARPQPFLSLGAAIATMGVLLGRKVRTETDIRTNVYILAICESGGGKEAPRSACKKILEASGCMGLIGMDDWASATGLVKMVDEKRSVICFTDEIGRVLKNISDPRSGQHQRDIETALLKMHSAAKSSFYGGAYADSQRNVCIEQPCFCIYGSTTPDTLWKAVNVDMLTQGLFSRMLLIRAEDDLPSLLDEICTVNPPESLCETVGAWYKYSPVNGNLGSFAASPVVVKKTDEAKALHRKWSAQCDDLARERKTKPAMGIFVRAAELSDQVALIHACSLHGSPVESRPHIGVDSVQYAIDLVKYIIEWTIKEASVYVGDTLYEKDTNSLIRALGKCGSEGISTGRLGNVWPKATPRARAEMLNDLEGRGVIKIIPATNRHGPKHARVVYVGAVDINELVKEPRCHTGPSAQGAAES